MSRKPMYVAIMGGSREGSSKIHTGCQVHLSLKDAALEAITEPKGAGYFRKDDVLKRAGFEFMADSIHWDYIVRSLEEDDDAKMIPLAGSFFSERRKMETAQRAGDTAEAMKIANRSVAGGHGKKTAGYASVALSNGLLTVVTMHRKHNRKLGAEQAERVIIDKAREKGITSIPGSRVEQFRIGDDTVSMTD